PLPMLGEGSRVCLQLPSPSIGRGAGGEGVRAQRLLATHVTARTLQQTSSLTERSLGRSPRATSSSLNAPCEPSSHAPLSLLDERTIFPVSRPFPPARSRA